MLSPCKESCITSHSIPYVLKESTIYNVTVHRLDSCCYKEGTRILETMAILAEVFCCYTRNSAVLMPSLTCFIVIWQSQRKTSLVGTKQIFTCLHCSVE